MSSMNQLSATLAPMLEPGETIRTWRSVVGEPKTSAPTFATDLALLGPAAFNAAATGTMAATGSIPAGTNLVVVTDRCLLWCSRQRLGGGITVLGFGTDEFPAFFTPQSGLPVAHRADTPQEVAAILRAKWGLGLEGGVLVANPVPAEHGFDAGAATEAALADAEAQGIEGKALTPFLLKHIAESTEGKSLKANVALVKHNARIGARIAVAYAQL